MLTVITASLIVMLAAFVGKMTTWRAAGPLIERNLHYLVSFAAGVLLLVAYNLTGEITEHAGSLWAGVPWIALGAGFIYIAFKYVPHFHHHHDSAASNHVHAPIDASRVLAGDAIHNIGDGVVIVVSFAASTAIGLASTFSILLHEILQEISQFFVLRQAGYSISRALIANFLAQSTILIGAVGSYFLLAKFEAIHVPLLGISVGAYLVVVFHDLIPHSLENAVEERHYVRHILFFIAGAILMYFLVTYLPHPGA